MSEKTLSLENANVQVVSTSSQEIQAITSERLAALPADQQQEVIDFSKKIDVSDSQIVTTYGNIPLENVANICGEFLQKMSGTVEDKEIVKLLVELSDATNSGQHEIEILAKKPNFFERIAYLFTGKDREQETKIVIKKTYDLICDLKEQMKTSIVTLTERCEEAKIITKGNVETAYALEKYLIAGYMALEAAREKASELEKSTLPQDQIAYKSLCSGIRTFEYKLSALEDAKMTAVLSAGQAVTAIESMDTLRVMIDTKSQIIITLYSQMSSNAILNNTTKRIYEGQRTMDEMSRQMILKVSQDAADMNVSIAKAFSKGAFDVDTIVQAFEILKSGYDEANSYYNSFSDNLVSELKKIRTAEESTRKVLSLAESSSVKVDSSGKGDSKLTL